MARDEDVGDPLRVADDEIVGRRRERRVAVVGQRLAGSVALHWFAGSTGGDAQSEASFTATAPVGAAGVPDADASVQRTSACAPVADGTGATATSPNCTEPATPCATLAVLASNPP